MTEEINFHAVLTKLKAAATSWFRRKDGGDTSEFILNFKKDSGTDFKLFIYYLDNHHDEVFNIVYEDDTMDVHAHEDDDYFDISMYDVVNCIIGRITEEQRQKLMSDKNFVRIFNIIVSLNIISNSDPKFAGRKV